jgi:hypothetical protein
MHDASAFRSVQHDARYAADQLAAFIAQAIAADVHPPRLLAEATWELWEFARSPTPTHAEGIPWPSTDPGAEVGEMRRRDFLTGTLAVTGTVLSETLAGMRPVDPEFITRALNTTHATVSSSIPLPPATTSARCSGTRQACVISLSRHPMDSGLVASLHTVMQPPKQHGSLRTDDTPRLPGSSLEKRWMLPPMPATMISLHTATASSDSLPPTSRTTRTAGLGSSAEVWMSPSMQRLSLAPMLRP